MIIKEGSVLDRQHRRQGHARGPMPHLDHSPAEAIALVLSTLGSGLGLSVKLAVGRGPTSRGWSLTGP